MISFYFEIVLIKTSYRFQGSELPSGSRARERARYSAGQSADVFASQLVDVVLREGTRIHYIAGREVTDISYYSFIQVAADGTTSWSEDFVLGPKNNEFRALHAN